MIKRKKLSEVQQFALAAANERVERVKEERRIIAVAVGKELGISIEELPNWRYAEDFSYIELPEKPKDQTKK